MVTGCFCAVTQVCKEDALTAWQLYLVDWGYNTQPERDAAAQNPRIHVVDQDHFTQLAHAKHAVDA